MTEPRVKSQIRVQAWLRQCSAQGLNGAVVRRGDDDAGSIILKINHFGAGADVYVAVTAADGSSGWMRALGGAAKPEPEVDAYIARQTKYDADIWVVEIEDPKGVFQFSEKVVEGLK
jgi:hypothetical protein